MANKLFNLGKRQPGRLPEEDQPDFLRHQEEQGDPQTTPAGKDYDPRGHDVAAGDSSDPRGPADEPDEDEPSFWRPASGTTSGRFRFRITRRRAIFGGGLIGTIVGVGLFLAITSGPFQFIHAAKLEQLFHLSQQEDAGDDRMGRMFRFFRSGGDVGETRLGWLGSKMKTNILGQLDEIGLKPDYKGAKLYQGFTLDRESPKSPYYNMTDEEVTQTLADKGINPKEISFEGGKAKVTVKGYLRQRKSLKILSDELHNSKIPGALRVRILSRYGLVTWHPLKFVDRKLNEKLATLYDKWQKARQERLAKGLEEGVSDPSNAKRKEQGKDSNGNPTDVLVDDHGPRTTDLKSIFNSIKTSRGLKIGGGFASGVGVVCIVKGVNDNIGEIRWIQVVAPLIRMGTDALTVGNQIMTGRDVSSVELSFLAKEFHDATSAWYMATPIMAREGKPGGIDITDTPNGASAKEAIGKGAPGWISWAGGVPKELCTGASYYIIGAFGLALGIFSAGLINTAAQVAVAGLVLPQVIEKLSAFLAGHAVNVLAQGAQWGNYIDYGTRLAGNSMSLLFGGVALTPAQEAELNARQDAKALAEFQNQSLGSKLFNPYEPRSAISQLIDNSTPGFSQNISHLAAGLLHIGNIFSATPRLLTATAHAAGPLPYDYGFAAYGFSAEDLQNQLVEDPYANADRAAQILDGPNGQRYIDRASACFGVTLKKGPASAQDSTQVWDVIPNDKAPNPYDPKYSDSDCTDAGNNEWLQIRFFIFDTAEMEGYACFQGDDQSCLNDGMDTSGAGQTGTTITGSSSASGYQNPFHDMTNLVTKRIDEGVDYAAQAGTTVPVYPIGNAVVTKVAAGNSTFYKPLPNWITYKLTDPNLPAHDKYVYVAEGCPPLVHEGDQVTTNTLLCNATPDSIETGWALDATSQAAAAVSVYNEGDATAYGRNFSDLLVKLGAPGGTYDHPEQKDHETGTLPSDWPRQW